MKPPTRHEFHLGCVGYVDDCLPEGGGFRVWPGTHRSLWPTFEQAYSQRHEDSEWQGQWTDTHGSDAYIAAIAELKKLEPVDCHGPAGTVVFWRAFASHGLRYQQLLSPVPTRPVYVSIADHRLGHDAGHNVAKVRPHA
jgi:hypothetical protein